MPRTHVRLASLLSDTWSRAANHLTLSFCNCSLKCYVNPPRYSYGLLWDDAPTQRKEVLHEKPTVAQLVMRFPAVYWTTMFTIVHKRACHWSLIPYHINPSHFIYLRFILVLSSHLYLDHPNGLYSSTFPTISLYTFFVSSMCATCPAHLILPDWINLRVGGIATSHGLDDRGVGVRIPVESRIFSSPQYSDLFWARPASYTMGTEGSFPGGKAAGTWSWPLTSI
jgi:hypothetical protein